jgi:A/G-specific adenine glycosylase
MWLFPNAEVGRNETPEAAAQRALASAAGLRGEPTGIVCVVRHSVTRFKITLDAYRLKSAVGSARPLSAAEVAWQKPTELGTLAMPAAHRTIAERLLEG